MAVTVFKHCGGCGREWLDRDSFLRDPAIVFAGYQVDFEDLQSGLFLFNHTAPRCGTTLSIAVESFADLGEGPVFRERLDGTATCPGYCVHEDDFRPCPEKCECVYIRQVLETVRQWPKDYIDPC